MVTIAHDSMKSTTYVIFSPNKNLLVDQQQKHGFAGLSVSLLRLSVKRYNR